MIVQLTLIWRPEKHYMQYGVRIVDWTIYFWSSLCYSKYTWWTVKVNERSSFRAWNSGTFSIIVPYKKCLFAGINFEFSKWMTILQFVTWWVNLASLSPLFDSSIPTFYRKWPTIQFCQFFIQTNNFCKPQAKSWTCVTTSGPKLLIIPHMYEHTYLQQIKVGGGWGGFQVHY